MQSETDNHTEGKRKKIQSYYLPPQIFINISHSQKTFIQTIPVVQPYLELTNRPFRSHSPTRGSSIHGLCRRPYWGPNLPSPFIIPPKGWCIHSQHERAGSCSLLGTDCATSVSPFWRAGDMRRWAINISPGLSLLLAGSATKGSFTWDSPRGIR